MVNFWDHVSNVQIATALFLIAVLLMYIAFREPRKSRKGR